MTTHQASISAPITSIENLLESLPWRVEVFITAKKGINLEWAVSQAHMDMKVNCPHSFGHKEDIHQGVDDYLTTKGV